MVGQVREMLGLKAKAIRRLYAKSFLKWVWPSRKLPE